MANLALVSPCITDWDAEGRLTGALSLAASDQAERVGDDVACELLSSHRVIRAVVSSGQQPYAAFASNLAKRLGVDWVEEPALWNQHLGLWQGMLFEDLRRKCPKVAQYLGDDSRDVLPPEGEGPDEVLRRLKPLVQRWRRENASIVVVSPRWIAGWVKSLATEAAPAVSLAAAEAAAGPLVDWFSVSAERRDVFSNWRLAGWSLWKPELPLTRRA